MSALDQAALHASIFLPVVGAVAVGAIPSRFDGLHQKVAVAFSGFVTLLGVYMLAAFNYSKSGPQYETNIDWIPVLNSNYHVFLDGVSLPLITLSMLITFLCVVYSWSHFPEPRNPRAFLSLLLLLETGVNGAFAAQDLLLFFVFFEIVLLPMYFLVGIWGGPRRQYAALKFFVYTVLGSAFMLLAFLALYFYGGHTFDIPTLSAANSPVRDAVHGTQLLIFAGLFIGFAIKVPLFPFHTWMPDAHTEAPTVASVLLAAVLLKLGTYGFIRIALPILPEAAESYAWLIGLSATVGIIYGALGCLAQRDMKRLIAFSSLAHMGYVMLGISTFTDFGLNAALFGMVAHGFITGMLFFLSGSIQHRLHTRDLNRFGGLLAVAPHLTWILGFCAMASLGMPGLAGFWGEFSAILSAFNPADGLSQTTFRVYMVLAAVGTVLGAGYLLWMYQRVAFGPPTETVTSRDVRDATISEYLSWAPLIIFIVLLGVVPSLLFNITNPAVDALLERMAQ